MKCLVTGSHGFIGSHLYNELLKRGHEVIGCDIKEISDARNNKNYIHDFTLIEKRDLEGIDCIFHLGAAAGSLHFLPDPIEGIKTNCIGTVHLLEAARLAGVKKIIFASTGTSYADTPIPHIETSWLNCPNFYTATKIFNEQSMKLYNQLYGLETIILRYASVYGVGEECKILPQGILANVLTQFIWQMIEGKQPEIWHTGEQTRDFIYVDDIVYANIFAAENLKHGIYNVGTGIETKFIDAVKLINKILGTNIEPKYVEATNKAVQTKYVDRQLFNNSKLMNLGWRWTVTLEEGIRRIINSRKKT